MISMGNKSSKRYIADIIMQQLELLQLGYAGCVEKLSKVLRPLSKESEADAAVVLLLKIEERNLDFLIVKRAESSEDPWSGQMALPGGKRDANDRNLKCTVVRETLEETNIDLLRQCSFLGLMETMRSTVKPEMKILPFVVLLEHEPSIKLNEELEGFDWVSLEKLAQHRGIAKFSFGEFPAYFVKKSVIWGLTYRILEKLLHVLESAW